MQSLSAFVARRSRAACRFRASASDPVSWTAPNAPCAGLTPYRAAPYRAAGSHAAVDLV